MKIGFIGLGKMGGHMVGRLIRDGHEIIAYDKNKDALNEAEKSGAVTANSSEEILKMLDEHIVWLMIPSDFVDDELASLSAAIDQNGIIIDGGNSDYRLTQKRAETCKSNNIQLVDVGTSGGILGVDHGYSLMVGGEKQAVSKLTSLFDSLAPPQGWRHLGPTGTGHYVKMVHNAIEYGIMESYAEGYRMLKDGPVEDIDLAHVSEAWQHGSIISSLLLNLILEIMHENKELGGVSGYVKESGEARWAIETARANGLELPAIKAALDVRIKSQSGETNYATKLLAAMRNKFGGHAVNKED